MPQANCRSCAIAQGEIKQLNAECTKLRGIINKTIADYGVTYGKLRVKRDCLEALADAVRAWRDNHELGTDAILRALAAYDEVAPPPKPRGRRKAVPPLANFGDISSLEVE